MTLQILQQLTENQVRQLAQKHFNLNDVTTMSRQQIETEIQQQPNWSEVVQQYKQEQQSSSGGQA